MSYPIKSIFMMSSALLLGACSSGSGADEAVIDKPDFTPTDSTYTIDALEALGRVSAPVLSHDGSKLLYGVSYESVEQNKSNLDLYTMNTDGSEVTRVTRTPKSENGYAWLDGGKKIAFLSPDGDNMQLWVMNADGSDR